MSLSSAVNVTNAALTTIGQETSVTSRNIGGVNETGFALKIANIATALGGGVTMTSVTNSQNQVLFENMLSATSSSAAEAALSAGLTQLQNTVGEPSSSTSPSSQISALVTALQQYEASPSDSSLAAGVVTAAQSVANTLNTATTAVQQLREQTDQQMASSVSSINSLLSQYQSVDQQIVTGTASGQDVTDLEDSRNSILTQLSQQIGISTVQGANGSLSIYTDGGTALYQNGQVYSLSFQPTLTYSAGTTGNAVYVNGVAITGSSSSVPIQSGALAGLANLRDNVTVTYQAQLDQTAEGLISAFSETNPTSGVTAAGLFTNAGSATIPASTATTGLAGTIEVNPLVNPAGTPAGNPQLVGNGITYDFNAAANGGTDAASYSGQIQNLLTSLSANQTFSAAGQIATTNTVEGYAQDSDAWLESQRQTASQESTYQSTLLSTSTTALSNATGVNLDSAMSQMLNLENSYSAAAKMMDTIDNMFTSLIDAVNPVAAS